MARPQLTPAQVVEAQMAQLELVIRNLLVDNRNFANGHYAEAHPGSGGFIHGPLRSMAEHILGRVEETRRLAMDMAAEREIPGLARIHTGIFHGKTVTVGAGRPPSK